MKIFTLLAVLFLSTALISEAQFRQDLTHQPEEYSAAASYTPSNAPGSWMNLLNMTMSHSYSMNFSNFGGQMQNLNAYTNHMFFDVSDRLNAQVDISVLHSPFGNSFMNNNNSLGAQIIVDQARLDYQLSSNAVISLQFSQRPYHYGFGPYGGGHYNPFNTMLPRY